MGGKARGAEGRGGPTDRPTERADGGRTETGRGTRNRTARRDLAFDADKKKNTRETSLAGRPGKARNREREQASKQRPKHAGRPRNQNKEPEQTDEETQTKTKQKKGGRGRLTIKGGMYCKIPCSD